MVNTLEYIISAEPLTHKTCVHASERACRSLQLQEHHMAQGCRADMQLCSKLMRQSTSRCVILVQSLDLWYPVVVKIVTIQCTVSGASILLHDLGVLPQCGFLSPEV